MEYKMVEPSPLLSNYIKHYWYLESCSPSGTKHIQRIVPSGLIECMFYFGKRPKSLTTKNSFEENSLLTGQLKTYYDIQITAPLSVFSIIFKPHGLAMFFDIPVNELLNQHVPLKYLEKIWANDLEAQLNEAKTFKEKVRIAEQSLIKKLKTNIKKIHFPRINESISHINNNRGMISINELASKACLSRKQFERLFTEYAGTSPKKFLRIVRFQHTLDQRSKRPDEKLTSLAYQCGYYDQSHMNREFYELSGMTPKNYFKLGPPFSDYFC